MTVQELAFATMEAAIARQVTLVSTVPEARVPMTVQAMGTVSDHIVFVRWVGLGLIVL